MGLMLAVYRSNMRVLIGDMSEDGARLSRELVLKQRQVQDECKVYDL